MNLIFKIVLLLILAIAFYIVIPTMKSIEFLFPIKFFPKEDDDEDFEVNEEFEIQNALAA